jgi:hypothetical protein
MSIGSSFFSFFIKDYLGFFSDFFGYALYLLEYWFALFWAAIFLSLVLLSILSNLFESFIVDFFDYLYSSV